MKMMKKILGWLGTKGNVTEPCPEISCKFAFTTRFVLEEHAKILRIICDSDGDLHFLSNDQFQDSDMEVVTLSQMLLMDNSLKIVYQLRPSTVAIRSFASSEWRVEEL
ncbi:MAG: hypothetical protein SFW35_05455 [Chitinophagales bacterium]|nr:hypothetical protein [Chitinophagales bacterium]